MWKDKIKSDIKRLLRLNIQYESEVFDYFLFYNISSGEYNIFPQSGENKCIFIAYDCDLQRLIIIDDYIINVD